jgi:hypothetical protein
MSQQHHLPDSKAENTVGDVVTPPAMSAQRAAELVGVELSADWVSIDKIKANTGLSSAQIVDALEMIERSRPIETSSRSNVSIRLRPDGGGDA